MSTLASVHQRGTRAAQPGAATVAVGTLYFVTDENIIERSSGIAWQSFSDSAGNGASSTTGNLVWMREETIIEESIPIPGPAGSSSGGSAGALVLLEQHSASASAALNFTTWYSSLYDEYIIELINVVPATNNVDGAMHMSTDGGATYDTTNLYTNSILVFNSTGQAVTGHPTTAPTSAFLVRNVAEINNLAAYGLNGTVHLFNPGSATVFKRIQGQYSYGSGTAPVLLQTIQYMGSYQNATAVNALRFLFTGGNIASGTIRIYGVAK